MYMNTTPPPPPVQDPNESAELDELMAQVWRRALQEDPQDQAKCDEGMAVALEGYSGSGSGGGGGGGFANTTTGPGAAMMVLAESPLADTDGAHYDPVSPFMTDNRSPLMAAMPLHHQSNNNNNNYSNASNGGILYSAAALSPPPPGGIALPTTGAYTKTHILMTPKTRAGVSIAATSPTAVGIEEEMVMLQQQQQQQQQKNSPFFVSPSYSPYEVATGRIGRAESAPMPWGTAASSSASLTTPLGQTQSLQPPPPPQPRTWASAHMPRTATPYQLHASPQRPQQTQHELAPVTMSSIAAAAAASSWGNESTEPSPSQRRLPPGVTLGSGFTNAAAASSPAFTGAVAARPQPRHPAAPTTASCATPLHTANGGAAPFSSPLYGATGGYGRTESPVVPSTAGFITPSSTPSRLPMPHGTPFSTSPFVNESPQMMMRGGQRGHFGTSHNVNMHSGTTSLHTQSHMPQRTSPLFATPPHTTPSRPTGDHLGLSGGGGGVPQVHVGVPKPRSGDSPLTPSVAPLLALLRGGGAIDKGAMRRTPSEKTLLQTALPSSPSLRPQGGAMSSPAREPLCLLASPQSQLPLKERVLRLSQDQVGCRMLQAIVDAETTGPEPPAVLFAASSAIQQLVEALMPDVATVMCDSYGNFLVQKIFDVAPSETRKRLLRDSTLSTQLVAVACSCHGTFAVQHLIETLTDAEEEELVKRALRCSTLQLLTDVNGGHVITKWLSYMKQRYGGLLTSLASTSAAQQTEAARAHRSTPVANPPSAAAALVARTLHEKTDFLFEGISAHLMTVCLDRHGCCAVQKTCDYWSAMSLPSPLALPTDHTQSPTGATREGADGLGLSLQRTPVRVVTEAVCANAMFDSLQRFVVALLDHVLELAADPFGNYVLTHAVKLCYVKGYLQLVDAIAGCLLQPEGAGPEETVQHVVQLCRNKFASNVVEQVLRLCGEKRVRALCRTLLYTPQSASQQQQQQQPQEMLRGVDHATSAAEAVPRTFLQPIAWNRAHADPQSAAAAKLGSAAASSSGSSEALPLLAIALDSYGNYVVQTLLTVAPVDELVTASTGPNAQEGVVDGDEQPMTGGILPILQDALPRLREKNFGRKMETKVGLAQLRVQSLH